MGDEVAEIGRLSGPLKKAYAEEHDLDYAELLTASSYKEQHRARMITWGEERRNADAGFFARKVLSGGVKAHPDHLRRAAAGRRRVLPGERAYRNNGARRGFTRNTEKRGAGPSRAVSTTPSPSAAWTLMGRGTSRRRRRGPGPARHLAVLTKKAADALATQADRMRAKMHKPT